VLRHPAGKRSISQRWLLQSSLQRLLHWSERQSGASRPDVVDMRQGRVRRIGRKVQAGMSGGSDCVRSHVLQVRRILPGLSVLEKTKMQRCRDEMRIRMLSGRVCLRFGRSQPLLCERWPDLRGTEQQGCRLLPGWTEMLHDGHHRGMLCRHSGMQGRHLPMRRQGWHNPVRSGMLQGR
jgi:hypothetical protein